MDRTSTRYLREHGTLTAMTRIYCREIHGSPSPCESCVRFLEYAAARLDRCTFGESKPACSECPVHCYHAEQKELARTIMRYAGPKMLWRHPILTILHFYDKWLSGSRISRWKESRVSRRTGAKGD